MLLAPPLLGDLYKEANAHVRACDSRALALNAAYSGVLLLALTGKAPLLRDDFLEDRLGLSPETMGLLSTLGLIAAGYAMLFVQFWLRAWKCHYANLCHALWREHPASFGDKVPVWMRGGVRFVSADLLYRTLPFGVNGLLLATLALDLQNRFGWGLGTAGALAGALLAAHLGVSYALSRSAADLERFSL